MRARRRAGYRSEGGAFQHIALEVGVGEERVAVEVGERNLGVADGEVGRIKGVVERAVGPEGLLEGKILILDLRLGEYISRRIYSA